MDSSLKSIQAQSYTCLQDGIYKICRAALQLWGALKQKTQPPVWACQLPGKNAKSLYPCWEVKKQRTTTTESPRELSLEFAPLPFCIPLVWMNISMFLPGWLFCCWNVGAFRWWLYIKGGRGRHLLPLSSAAAERWDNRRARTTGLRPKKVWFFRKQNRAFFKWNSFCTISLTVSKHYRRKKKLQSWGSIWDLQQTWKDIGSPGCTLSKYLAEMMHKVHHEEWHQDGTETREGVGNGAGVQPAGIRLQQQRGSVDNSRSAGT